MRYLLGDQWSDSFLDYYCGPDAYRIQVSAFANLEQLTGIYFVPLRSARLLWNYLREVGPGNLEYDKFLKGYKPTAEFVPSVTRGVADEYLHLMARNNELNDVFESLALNNANAESLAVPVRYFFQRLGIRYIYHGLFIQ